MSYHLSASTPKGHLISKCLFGVIIWTKKKKQKYCKDFYPESYYSFLGASWKLPYQWYYLLSPQEAPRKLQKNSRTEILEIFLCYFGPNDDTKKTFRGQLTFRSTMHVQYILYSHIQKKKMEYIRWTWKFWVRTKIWSHISLNTFNTYVWSYAL